MVIDWHRGLLVKQFEVGLTPKETAELEQLKRRADALIDRRSPLPAFRIPEIRGLPIPSPVPPRRGVGTDVLFDYPRQPHVRRHEPRGYANYVSYKPWLRDEFGFRCVYCLSREIWFPSGQHSFGVSHIIPKSHSPEHAGTYGNLLYLCDRCNAFQGTSLLLDPCKVGLGEHVRVEAVGKITPLTGSGARLIAILQLDSDTRTGFRRRLLSVVSALLESDHHNAKRLLDQWLGFPHDLPDLSRCKPPGGNTRPEGTFASEFMSRLRRAPACGLSLVDIEQLAIDLGLELAEAYPVVERLTSGPAAAAVRVFSYVGDDPPTLVTLDDVVANLQKRIRNDTFDAAWETWARKVRVAWVPAKANDVRRG